ncbi:MAG TPA: carboxypeptidase M32 [Myxococcota bacterium]|nr:carboxypeptidase M32 [Myxococcota bacterium]
MQELWENFTRRTGELDALAGAMGLLEWDQQTYMPRGSGAVRGAQSAALGRLHHQLSVDPDLGSWLQQLQKQKLDELKTAAVRNAWRRYQRSTLLPSRLVEELAVARTEGFAAWMRAREVADFAPYSAALQRLIDLNREAAERLAVIGPVKHPYDALLEDFDPGSTVAELAPMFKRLSAGLQVFLKAIEGKEGPAALELKLDTDGQRRISMRLLKDLGFDLSVGRLDEAEHPFTVGMDRSDVRLTTHLHEDNFLATLGGTVHECGHGLYEQGLRGDWAGTGVNRAAGAGIHESQSRFWENFIGRSLPFFRYLVPRMTGIWPNLSLTPEQIFGGANRVSRSLIRIFADEVTYNLHIVARFELEVALFEGKLQAADLPDAWNAAYARNVGVVAENPRDGILQDVHWSSGLFGYFPSYTIGNLYAASFGACIAGDLPDLWTRVEAGDFAPILGWLREKVHARGHIKDAPEIYREIAGNRDPVEDLLSHIWSRQGKLYGVSRPAE